MKRKQISFIALGALCAAVLAPLTAFALIMVGKGNTPVRDYGWPDGALAVANLTNRVGWWEGPPFGGGQWCFLYRGNTEVFQTTLSNFAAIRAPALDLVIHDGPQENTFLRDERNTNADTRVDWTFTVWVPSNWHRLYNNPKTAFMADRAEHGKQVDPPKLDVYISTGGAVDWDKVKVPANIRVKDERASASGVDLSGGSMVRADFYDMGTGKAVSGARIIVEKVTWVTNTPAHYEYENLGETVSDSTGHAELARIPNSTNRVRVTGPGYAPRWMQQQAFTHPTLVKYSVELAPASTVKGTVTDTDGKPVKGAWVRPQTLIAFNGEGYHNGQHFEQLEKVAVKTDEAGRFEINDLAAGYMQFNVIAEGFYYGDISTIHDVPSSTISLKVSGAGALEILITDAKGTPISKFEGKPINYDIEPKGGNKVGSWGGGGFIGETGSRTITNVPPGEYRITSKPNPGSTTRQYTPDQVVIIKPGQRTTIKMAYE